jgi:hypothetical protein
MYRSAARFTFLLIVALVALAPPGRSAAQAAWGGPTIHAQSRSSQTPDLTVAPKDGRLGSIRGSVVDQSAGVLPGVTVIATAIDGRPLDTTVTNAAGEFAFDGLPAGPLDLVFRLDAFDHSETRVTIQPGRPVGPGRDARLVHQMELLAHTENVVVHGDAPPTLLPPRPMLTPVPDHDRASVCGPAEADGPVPSFGAIRSRQDEAAHGLFAAGDELQIDGGTLNGLEVGQNFVVRRRYTTALTGPRRVIVMGEHSSGLLQMVTVDAQLSTAVVVYVCDEMMGGDYLVPFEPEPILVPGPFGTPAFDKAARILFADAGQLLGAPRRMMVVDRGTRHGLWRGQRLTLFRRSRVGDAKPTIVGEAVVVAVRKHSATIRVEQATDAIFFGDSGDWAAPHSPRARK